MFIFYPNTQTQNKILQRNIRPCGPTIVYALRRWLIAISSLNFYTLHKWLVSYCCHGQLAHASRCTVMHKRFRNKCWQKHYRRQSLWDQWHRVSHCPTNWLAFLLFNKSIKTRDAQASLGYPDRYLRCDGRPSTPVLRNAEQWWHQLARPLLHVVLPRFTRSTSTTHSVHGALLLLRTFI